MEFWTERLLEKQGASPERFRPERLLRRCDMLLCYPVEYSVRNVNGPNNLPSYFFSCALNGRETLKFRLVMECTCDTPKMFSCVSTTDLFSCEATSRYKDSVCYFLATIFLSAITKAISLY